MGDELEAALWLGMAALAFWIAAPATVAAVRGYDPERWFLACGVIGVIVLMYFPVVPRNGPATVEAASRRRAADRAGELLSGLQVAVFLTACAISAWRTYGPR